MVRNVRDVSNGDSRVQRGVSGVSPGFGARHRVKCETRACRWHVPNMIVKELFLNPVQGWFL